MKWENRPERNTALRQTNGAYRPQGGASWLETIAVFVCVVGLIVVLVIGAAR